MPKLIVLFIFFALGLFAQQANERYTCSDGNVNWKADKAPSTNEKVAAQTNCCKLRTNYQDYGKGQKDLEVCKSTPPDKERLDLFHADCGFARMPWCSYLLPQSMGKDYSAKPKPPAPAKKKQ